MPSLYAVRVQNSLCNVAYEGDIVAFDDDAADIALLTAPFHVDFARLVQHHVHELVETLATPKTLKLAVDQGRTNVAV